MMAVQLIMARYLVTNVSREYQGCDEFYLQEDRAMASQGTVSEANV